MMSKLFYYVLFTFASITIAQAQCNEYYVFQENSEWEYETYNAKGKLSGKNQQKVTDFSKNPNGYVATVNSTIFDNKGKEVTTGEMVFKCENGTMYLDMRNFISEEQLKAFSSYEVKVEATNLEIPASLSTGESLGDGKFTITTSGGPIPMKMTMTITDRKVEARESITTPAGTFDCFKITSNMIMENHMGVKITNQFSTAEWIAPKVGAVKSESYNKNNKLSSYTVLSKRVN